MSEGSTFPFLAVSPLRLTTMTMTQTAQRTPFDRESLRDECDRFMEHGAMGRRESSMGAYKPGIRHFIDYAEERGVTHLSGLNRALLVDFRTYIDGTDYARSTQEHYVKSVREWIKWLEMRGRLPDGLGEDAHELIKPVELTREERRSDARLDINRADRIVSWLDEHEPHSRRAIIFKVLAKTGVRTCELRALDLEDVEMTDTGGRLKVRHRPKKGTPLKRAMHDRHVPINRALYEDIRTYAEHYRKDATDDYGREPLITTVKGRACSTTISDTVYLLTCPQTTNIGECDCDGRRRVGEASRCEESVGPHAIRAMAVTKASNNGATWRECAAMFGARSDTLRRHYDRGTKDEKEGRARSVADAL